MGRRMDGERLDGGILDEADNGGTEWGESKGMEEERGVISV